jgi:hypothetical protein
MVQLVDLEKINETAKRLNLHKRKCSDSFCCFLTKEFARHIDIERTHNLVYLSLKEDGSVYEGKRFACKNLEVSLEDEAIKFACRIYESRHPHCKIHPEGGVYVMKEGRFSKRIEVPKQKCQHEFLRENKIIYPFYLLKAEKFPQFEPYALSVKDGYLFIPVPISK